VSNKLAVVAKLRAASGRGDALAALLVEQAATVRRLEPGCLEYRPHRAADDADVFVFYELYDDEAAFEAHRTSAHMAEFRQRRESQGFSAGPAEVWFFKALVE
jgi:quinol monooxygenase YgiN